MITTNVIGGGVADSLLASFQNMKETVCAYVLDKGGDEGVVDTTVKIIEKAMLALEELRLAEEAIQTDASLSSIGKAERMQKVVTTIYKQLVFVRTRADEQFDAYESDFKLLQCKPYVLSWRRLLSYIRTTSFIVT